MSAAAAAATTTTAKQIEANRANALKSTGPTSDAGKARSARNALSHGLTSKDLFVPAGQEAEFEAFQEDLQRDLNPEGPAETLFFNDILSASWRLLRCDRAEAGLASRTSEPGLDPLLDPALEPTLRTIERARAQAAKLLHKSIAELRRVQTEFQYRAAAMPADEGYIIDCLGLGDWQTIRARMKKERSLDALNIARETQNLRNEAKAEARAMADEFIHSIEAEAQQFLGTSRAASPARVPAAPPQTGKTNPIAAPVAPFSASTPGKTNPIPTRAQAA